ncbi:CDP-archaeol synthase [Testudinibacter sp. TR-2022]|uniref:CDP-archaeol synthase n=1 Tax=Testudinibacter sp. TR-2022 TaxID=2585029 RepID=UPI00111A91C1|nr:CDP-archaeol synthase [Testudinibacter sp. TR-2022]TNH05529.1 CDP-archaeol synthase [Pasteurellaceae bacterium Phil31]TNH11561.1 CDP-archaeol synthase [Testudinibacter sp. TR-2022]TNH11928.1 CDP-archaeol synthase [Testudinibacter sp. TR-2022]TNH12646.1 CDP-archaeol synthase [Testudinibacter sp. TR-2022]TNH18038.1 CDP-archaeol synthase [Testudinibacter sp. TR-2022]
MLKQRIISAAVLLIFVITALLLFSPYAFALTVAAIVVLGIWEWCQFARHQNDIWRWLITGLSACALFVIIFSYRDYINAGIVLNSYTAWLLVVALIWWVLALLLVASYPHSTKYWQKPALLQLFFGFFTLAPFLLALLALRLYNYNQNSYEGLWLLFYVLLLIWSADTGAYFCGKAFGKHKLAAKVSPGKTWQGAIGGVVVALVVGILFLQMTPNEFVLRSVSLPLLLLASFGTVSISILGDLTESMFKRHVGIKDSSQLIPGHGGILDRIDSLTAALPFFCAMFYFYL